MRRLLLLVTVQLFLLLMTSSLSKAQAAGLYLTPTQGQVKAGENLTVQIMLDPKEGELIDGVDAVLIFDTAKIKPLEVKAGKAFKNLVTKESSGRVQITGLAGKEGQRFSEVADMALVSFEILESGKVEVGFDFTSGITTDSNVAEHKSGKDLLTSVVGGNYSVQATTVAQTFSILRRAVPVLAAAFFLLAVFAALFWFFKNRPKRLAEDVFYPSPVPLDRLPDQTKEETIDKPGPTEGS